MRRVERERGLHCNVDAKLCITLTAEVDYALREFVQHYSTEVSGCGLVEKVVHMWEETTGFNKEKHTSVEFRVSEIFLPEKQRNTGASTDIDEEQVHGIIHELVTSGKDPNKLKLHWHSHANMGVFHSATDEENYEDLNNGDFLVSLVLNKDGDVLGRVDFYTEPTISLIDVPVRVLTQVDENTVRRVKESIEKLDKNNAENKIVTYGHWDDWDDERRWDNWKNPNKEAKGKEYKKKGKKPVGSVGSFDAGGKFYRERLEEKSKKTAAELWAEARIAVAGTLGITLEDALIFEKCENKSCWQCAEQHICDMYNYDLLKAMEGFEE